MTKIGFRPTYEDIFYLNIQTTILGSSGKQKKYASDHLVACQNERSRQTNNNENKNNQTAPKVAKAKVQDADLDALEQKLRSLKTSFLSGNAPGSVDKEMYEKISGKSFIGYPVSAGWFSTVSMFEGNVRNSW